MFSVFTPNEPHAGSSTPATALLTARGYRLSYHYRPSKSNISRITVLYLSGWKGEMFGTKATHIDAWCQQHDISCLRFDYSGHGQSEGEFHSGTIGQWIADTLDIIDHCTQGPLLIIGSSMGAWLMLHAALARAERVCGLVGLASAINFTDRHFWAPLNPQQRQQFRQQGYWPPSPSSARREATSPVPEAPTVDEPPTLSWSFVEEAQRHLISFPLSLPCPLSLIHGLDDTLISWEESHELQHQCTGPYVILHLVKQADHRLGDPTSLGLLDLVLTYHIKEHTHHG